MSPITGIRTGSLVMAFCALASCGLSPLSQGVIEGKVVLGVEPIAGATVTAYRLNVLGELYSTEPIATAVTDDAGAYRLDMGNAHGTMLVLARGGSTHEHWAPDRLVFPFDESEPPDESRQLRAVIPHYTPVRPRPVAITPFTTMAAHLAYGRLIAQLDPTYRDAARRANELMSMHLGVDIDIIATQPADVREFADGMTPSVAYGLALAALSTLAGRMADETPDSIQTINTMTLTMALANDARVDRPEQLPIFDGMDPEGVLEMGVCIPPPECTDPEECPLCLLASRTLRRDLAESLLFWFVPSAANGSGRDFMDVVYMATGINENLEPEIFGMVTAEPLDATPPQIAILPSPINDERSDDITFNAYAAPIHDLIGPLIDLGDASQCPTVYKHVNRMDDASQNPLRWRFSATDDSVQLAEYRVRNLSTGQWLTDWTLAQPTTPGGTEYAITLLRGDIPELATTEATMEIQIRVRDWFENMAGPISRCWQHIPLAAPLRVGPATEATGPGSLQAVDIDPDTYDLAMLINATTEREIMWFEVANGTDDPVYVTLDHTQPGAEYDLTWQRSNIELSREAAPPGCTTDVNGTCPLPWPSAYQSDGATLINQPVPSNIWGLRVWDITTGIPFLMNSCDGCSATEYLISPRVDPTRPRRYRLALVVNDLTILAPRHFSGPVEQYEDVALDYPPGLVITGKRYDILYKCISGGLGACMIAGSYRHYRAIRSAALRASITVTGQVAPTGGLLPRLPAPWPGTFGIPPTITSFRWEVDELALPDAVPPL